MALASVHPAAALGALLQQGGDDIATRVDVFEEIYFFFLLLGTLVGVIVVTYMLHKAYKYRDGNGKEYDVARPELGELPTGSDKGGRKLFVSFGLSALIVISLIGWTYSWLLYVETGTADVPEDAIEVDVTGEDFAWEFEYEDDERLATESLGIAINDSVEQLGQSGVLDAINEAETDPDLDYDEALAQRLDEADDEESYSAEDVDTNVREIGTFTVPHDREVHIDVTSGDVWHNFGITDFRVKADAMPGETTSTWFVPDETGTFQAECFELCGSGHSAMTATVESVSQEQYEEWYDQRSIEIDELKAQLEAGEYELDDGESGADGGNETDGGDGDAADGGGGNGTDDGGDGNTTDGDAAASVAAADAGVIGA